MKLKIFFLIFIFLNFPIISSAAPAAVPQTGQTVSYDSSDDGDLQAGVPLPTPRFIENPDDTVTDVLTGLMWLKDANCIQSMYPGLDIDGIAGDGRVTWRRALDFVSGVNSGTYSGCGAGRTGWRLPNIRELRSLTNMNYYEPSISSASGGYKWTDDDPFVNVQSNNYWSGTSVAGDSGNAWVVYLWNGNAYWENKGADFYVWLVRDGISGQAEVPQTGQTTTYTADDDGDVQAGVALPQPRFTDNLDGTVTDELTGLEWLKNANCIDTNYSSFDKDGTSGDGRVTWSHALDFVDGINSGTYSACGAGKSDWRLPNEKDLWSLINFAYDKPSISNTQGDDHWSEGDPFNNVENNKYWSGTTSAVHSDFAWNVNPAYGLSDWVDKGLERYVWPVRGGQYHSLTVSISGTGSGTITSVPSGIDCGEICSAGYISGTSVTLTQEADSDSIFQGWYGDCNDNGRVTMSQDKFCVALFNLKNTVTATADPENGGEVVCSPNPVEDGESSTCEITVNQGYVLESITGTCGGTLSGDTFTTDPITSSCTVVANFSVQQHNLSVILEGSGSGTVTSDPSVIECGEECDAAFGYETVVTLFAEEEQGSEFINWGGDCDANGTVVMDDDKTCTARFDTSQLVISTESFPEEGGYVNCVPSAVDEGGSSNCTISVNYGYTLESVNGTCEGSLTDNTYTIDEVTSSCTVEANFSINQYSLNVNIHGNGSGNVTSLPAGIDCDGNCSAIFDYSTEVTLLSEPDSNSTFGGWSGDCDVNGLVVITDDLSCNATFTLKQYDIEEVVAPLFGGEINCTPNPVEHGQSANCTITPGTGYEVESVTGCLGELDDNNYTTGPVTSDCTVSVEFDLIKYPLNVKITGTGRGRVTSQPAGIDCEYECWHEWDYGTEVTLEAFENPDSTFLEWRGDCDANGTVVMDSSKECQAVFRGGNLLMRIVPIIIMEKESTEN